MFYLEAPLAFVALQLPLELHKIYIWQYKLVMEMTWLMCFILHSQLKLCSKIWNYFFFFVINCHGNTLIIPKVPQAAITSRARRLKVSGFIFVMTGFFCFFKHLLRISCDKNECVHFLTETAGGATVLLPVKPICSSSSRNKLNELCLVFPLKGRRRQLPRQTFNPRVWKKKKFCRLSTTETKVNKQFVFIPFYAWMRG